MILDNDLIFSDAQDIGQTVATYVGTNVYDHGAAQTAPGGYGTIQKDVFAGEFAKMALLISIIEAVTSAGAATINFQLVQSANADLSSPDVLSQTGALAYTLLTAGKRIALPVPPHGLTKRYFGVQYVIAGATTTAGTVTAGLVRNLDTGLAVPVASLI